MKQLTHKEKLYERLRRILRDHETLLELSLEASDEEQPQLEGAFRELDDMVRETKTLLYLSGKYDHHDALLTFHAGTGGTDAQDWTEMLIRMMLRFCERQEWTVTILDQSFGEEAGVKSATMEVVGPMAYGLLRSEHGVHRLVRQSPFNSGQSRETSFAMIEVTPIIETGMDISVDQEDLRIDVFRAGGKGGQGVNTTDSAVRITHLPTGLVVQCQNERSQLQNKQHAMKVLLSKLAELKEREQVKELSDIKGKRTEIAWGNQIRSYVLHPYKMVKDHRTEVETSQVEKVLDGDLMMFIEGWLRQQAHGVA